MKKHSVWAAAPHRRFKNGFLGVPKPMFERLSTQKTSDLIPNGLWTCFLSSKPLGTDPNPLVKQKATKCHSINFTAYIWNDCLRVIALGMDSRFSSIFWQLGYHVLNTILWPDKHAHFGEFSVYLFSSRNKNPGDLAQSFFVFSRNYNNVEPPRAGPSFTDLDNVCYQFYFILARHRRFFWHFSNQKYFFVQVRKFPKILQDFNTRCPRLRGQFSRDSGDFWWVLRLKSVSKWIPG